MNFVQAVFGNKNLYKRLIFSTTAYDFFVLYTDHKKMGYEVIDMTSTKNQDFGKNRRLQWCDQRNIFKK